MSKPELLPCPFCGSADLGLTWSPAARSRWVECNTCGVMGPIPSLGLGKDGMDRDALWNVRAFASREERLRDVLERLVCELDDHVPITGAECQTLCKHGHCRAVLLLAEARSILTEKGQGKP